MHRLFVAVDIPETHVDTLTQVRDNTLNARWTPSDQYHLTLRFIGDTDDTHMETIRENLAGISHSSFTCNISGLGSFPSRSKPRVLVVRIEDNPALLALQRDVDRVLCELGVETDKKSFRPHITIARLKWAKSEDVEWFMRDHESLELEPFIVSSFYLYESTLRCSGAVHTRLKRYELV